MKFEGLAASGGEAKSAIAEGRVLVNGEIETRKRKKIVSGDVVSFDGVSIRIQLKGASKNQISKQDKAGTKNIDAAYK